MRARLTSIAVIVLLLLVALVLVGCERDRPVPTPVPTVTGSAAGTGSGEAPAAGTSESAGEGATTGEQLELPTPVPLSGQGSTSAATTAPASGEQPQTQVNIDQVSVYVIKPGDTLTSIAKKYGLTAAAIMAANPDIKNPDSLKVDQKIQIPASSGAGATSGTSTTTQSSGEPRVYVVKQGDTLGSIAKSFGVSTAEIQKLNKIEDPNQIYVGQKLLIPSSPLTPAPSQGTTYVVQQGDSLGSIAKKYGKTVAELQTANNITDPNKIYPGQVLIIP